MRKTLLVLIWGCLLACGAWAQPTEEFVVKTQKVPWLDQNNQPWSDLSCKLAVRLDPQFASNLGLARNDEITGSDNPAVKFTTSPQLFSLRSEGGQTFAEVPFLVFKNKTDAVVYQIELQREGRAVVFAPGSSSKYSISNNSPAPRAGVAGIPNPTQLKDWLIVVGVLLVSALFIYFLIFRGLFKGLLGRGWTTSSAENFTASLSLLLWFVAGLALTFVYLGPRLETYIISGLLALFWLMHGVVWLVSKK